MKTEQLEKLGFKKAANEVKVKREMKRKMVIAYENFRYVRQEKIDAFSQKLRKKTEKHQDYHITYDTLAFTPIVEYETIPPQTVLDEIEKAQEFNCFDTFEIATIKSVKEVKDPIVFGRVKGCPDRFYIAQWDDDVKIEDILKENEG